MTSLSRLLVGAALAVALALGPAAAAAPLGNLVPNAAFEDTSCGPTVTCSWASTGTASATRDTSQNHTPLGSASLLLDATPIGGAAGSRSICFSGVTGSTTYFFSAWYRTADPNVATIEPRLEFWNDTTCQNSTMTLDLTTTPTRDGAWHKLSGSATSPAATVRAWVQLTEICTFGMTDCVTNFDDIAVDTAPTVVRVASFAARRSTAGVDLTWRSPSSAATLGFNVWRGDSKLNRSLVLSRGAAYRYVDRTALPGRSYVYKLQLVRPDGSRVWAASVRVGAARG